MIEISVALLVRLRADRIHSPVFDANRQRSIGHGLTPGTKLRGLQYHIGRRIVVSLAPEAVYRMMTLRYLWRQNWGCDIMQVDAAERMAARYTRQAV